MGQNFPKSMPGYFGITGRATKAPHGLCNVDSGLY